MEGAERVVGLLAVNITGDEVRRVGLLEGSMEGLLDRIEFLESIEGVERKGLLLLSMEGVERKGLVLIRRDDVIKLDCDVMAGVTASVMTGTLCWSNRGWSSLRSCGASCIMLAKAWRGGGRQL